MTIAHGTHIRIMGSRVLKNHFEKFSKQPPVYFLKRKDEAFLVALPWIGAVLTVGFWFLGRFGLNWSISDIPLMLTGLIFIDGVHVVFSLIMLLSLPELQTWSKSEALRSTSGWSKGMSFWTRTAAIAFGLGVCIYLLKVYPGTFTLRGMATTFLLLELLGPAQHTIAQMRGISLCYNGALKRAYKFTDDEKARALLNESIERKLFLGLLIGEIFYWIPDIFQMDRLNIPEIASVHFVGGVLAVACAAGLVVNGLYFPKQENSRKSAFLFRAILFPLKMLTTIGGITLRAAHGTEYLVVFKRMVQGSKITPKKQARIFLLTAAVSVVYALFFCLTWPSAISELMGQTPPTLLLSVALVLTFVVRFTHYYTDSVLYRMSDPATRSVVGPLLTVPPPEECKQITTEEIVARDLHQFTSKPPLAETAAAVVERA